MNILSGLFNNKPKNIKSSPTGDTMVQIGGSNTSAFGDLIVSPNTPIIQFDFITGLNTQIVKSTVLNSATVDTNLGRGRLQSGTNTAGSAILESLKTIRYRAGQGMTARFTYTWTNNIANNTHCIGVGNSADGYFFGYNGTSFGILHRNSGTGSLVDTWITQSNWNGDLCDGTGESGFNWDKTKGNVMMIRYPFLGYGAITFWVLSSLGQWILCHTIAYPNTSNVIQISNPNLSFYIFNINNGNTTTNIIGYCGSVGMLLSGDRKFLGPKGGNNNNKAITAGNRTNLITIKNATTYNGSINRSLIRLTSISFAFGNLANNAFGYIQLLKNATLGGTPAYTPFNGITADNGVTITSGNSVISTDKAGTTVTGGTVEWNSTGSVATTGILNVSDFDLFLEPGSTYTFASDVTANANVGVAFNWVEDI